MHTEALARRIRQLRPMARVREPRQPAQPCEGRAWAYSSADAHTALSHFRQHAWAYSRRAVWSDRRRHVRVEQRQRVERDRILRAAPRRWRTRWWHGLWRAHGCGRGCVRAEAVSSCCGALAAPQEGLLLGEQRRELGVVGAAARRCDGHARGYVARQPGHGGRRRGAGGTGTRERTPSSEPRRRSTCARRRLGWSASVRRASYLRVSALMQSHCKVAHIPVRPSPATPRQWCGCKGVHLPVRPSPATPRQSCG